MKTKKIQVNTYEQFKRYFDNINFNENKKYKFVVNALEEDIQRMVSLYNDMEKLNTDISNCIEFIINVIISSKEDFKTKFGNLFCELASNNKRRIKKEFTNIQFNFIVEILQERTIKSYREIFDYYRMFFEKQIYVDVIKNIAISIKVTINNNTDTLCVCEQLFKKVLIEKELKNSNVDIIIFQKSKSDDNFIMRTLHETVLICKKYKLRCDYCCLHLQAKLDIFKIKAYLAAVIDEKLHVFYNGSEINADIESVGKLPPAVFIEDFNDLNFFQQPLNKQIWDQIIKMENGKIVPISKDSFLNITGEYACIATKYWSYLRMCQKFLMNEFDGNISRVYTQIRRDLYSNHKFYNDYVRMMPFFAICIFALYDNFYRDDLLRKYKEKSGILSLKEYDIILSKQYKQPWNNFIKYQNIKKDYDIKNLAYDDKNIHKTVEAELFESVSISEGILQILENAVLHAGGGLLSMRVYSRAQGIKTGKYKKPEHVQYLRSIYGQNYLEFISTDFFLEVQISDLSNNSIGDKFLNNYCNIYANQCATQKELEQMIELKELLERNKDLITLEYFFSPSNEQNKLKNSFYKLNVENLVHHYGLEIFNSILSTRNGIFSVESYGDGLDNLEYIFDQIYKDVDNLVFNKDSTISKFLNMINYSDNIEKCIESAKSKNIDSVRNAIQNFGIKEGTKYRMLLPLSHASHANNYPASNDVIIKENIDEVNFDLPCIIGILELLKEDLLTEEIGDKNKLLTILKQQKINKLANRIEEIYSKEEKETCLCINLYEETNIIDMYFEIIVKSVLLFALKRLKYSHDIKIPIAIVNITPVQLIEATRIITIYFTKDAKKNENIFEHIPLYLKCRDVCKDIIFAGKNVTEVKDGILKMAMANGTMFNEITTISEMLNKATKSNRRTKDE